MLYFFFFAVFSLALNVHALEDEPERARKLYNQIKCPTCHGQSIKESNAPAAQDIKFFIDQSIKDGLSDTEIINELKLSYGEEIAFVPQFTIYTYALWLAPFVLLLLFLVFFRKKICFRDS